MTCLALWNRLYKSRYKESYLPKGVLGVYKTLKNPIGLGSYLIIALDMGLLNQQQTINIPGSVLTLA